MVVEVGKQSGVMARNHTRKYVQNRQTALVHHRQTNCTCWANLLKVKHFYLENKHMRVGNGEATSL
jgi:hypothetical protein